MTDAAMIQEPHRLQRLGESLARETHFALDTEADSFHSYRGKLCLLQVSTRRRTFLVDTLALSDLSPLALAFASPAIRTVLHGADYDLRILDRDAGLRVRGIFDTMVAARVLGRARVGLAALLEEEFDIQLDKSSQRADWSRRPLPGKLQAYAAADTRHLPDLHDRLERELARRQRSAWAREEFERLEEVRYVPAPPDPQAWRRIKGASRLDGRAQAVLRAVLRWREEEAARLDLPPFKVLGREALLEIAQHPPADRENLARIQGWRRSGARLRASRLLENVRVGLAEELLPPPPSRKRPPRDRVAEEALARAKDYRDREARQLGLDPGFLLPNGVIELLVEAARLGEEDPLDVPGLRRWQSELMAAELRTLLPPARCQP